MCTLPLAPGIHWKQSYVPTTWAKRNISAVRRDIATYAEWPTNSSNPKLAVRGIFFDETPQQYDADALSYLQELTSFVKGLSGLGPDNFVCVTLLFHPSVICITARYSW
ncbi:unnamed protein product [Aspergillus oryzae RIB40]|uniref:DNA, SC005 n=2 Tax=Aspergillus oryzae TaxID=5062 RepID=Q2UPV9_ASPOR|nr:unnamed protein product [Aspergillus oryzae RIB40]EIT79766.1 hypothetical protein Ao3042_03799 [Aspergillus oryzae 3.042]KDE79848.1 hypothetical protein AO1008_06198 [Aspergillus oryzae 100-8]BAE56406.1 unnamed protein product [Aspergillus oryzae RIB40]|eukprot:EIT79766.1 hypothetical protein Ao3042_03799 [Aspergillus oryzae 3.042]